MLLKNTSCECSKCNMMLIAEKNWSPISSVSEWTEVYFIQILAPGCMRRCCFCRGDNTKPEKYICAVCKVTDNNLFHTSRITNMAGRGRKFLCIECPKPPCTLDNCKTCKTCRSSQCIGGNCRSEIQPLNSKNQPNTLKQKEEWVCEQCKQTALVCCVCFEKRPNCFNSCLKNYQTCANQIMCIDCMHPQCAAPNCTTCRQCRREECLNGPKCNVSIMALHYTDLPKTLEAKNAWRCKNCMEHKYICSKCKDTGPANKFHVKHIARDTKNGTVLCLECQEGRTKGINCIKCTAFSPAHVLTKTEMVHYVGTASRDFMCPKCVGAGYTLKNNREYNCTFVQRKAGALFFRKKILNELWNVSLYCAWNFKKIFLRVAAMHADPGDMHLMDVGKCVDGETHKNWFKQMWKWGCQLELQKNHE